MKSIRCLLVNCLCNVALADWQFRSRPDLSVPELNITTPAHKNTESGFIFVAQYQGFVPGSWGPQQAGAYIFKDDGDLVWSGIGHLGGWITDFRPTEYEGKPVLQAFEGSLDASHGRMYGKHSILNQNYETIKTVTAGNHRLVSCHEFHVTNEGTVLIETPLAIPTDLSKWGGAKDQQWIVTNGFQELDIATGKLVFEWFSLDHADPTHSAFPLRRLERDPDLGEEGSDPFNAKNSTDAWNYFHINSVDKDDQGNYLISARNYRAIFKIDGKTGNIIWQLGGLHGSNFTIAKEIEFAYQHDARFQDRSQDGSIEIISFFDNAAHSEPGYDISPFSRGRFVQLNHTSGEATEVATFPAPFGLSTKSQGNVQKLANGNVFVNWGQAGAVTEFAWDGDVLFHAFLDSKPNGLHVQSYRGFRANWTGTPNEEPAIVALGAAKNDNEFTIYVSWNGDTEAVAWRLYAESQSGTLTHKVLLGEANRTTFETHFVVSKSIAERLPAGSRILAAAIDEQGRILVSSQAVEIRTAGTSLSPTFQEEKDSHHILTMRTDLK